jgi:hypothetical protein
MNYSSIYIYLFISYLEMMMNPNTETMNPITKQILK